MKKFTEIYNDVTQDRHYLEKVKVEYTVKIIKKFFWFIIVFMAIVGTMCILGRVSPKELISDRTSAMVLGIFFMISMACFCYSCVHLRNDFRLKYKESVVKRIVDNIDNNLNYRPSGGISLMEYHRGFRDRSERISSEDLIEGMLNDTNITLKMSQVKATHIEETTDSHGRRSRTTVTDYFGLFGYATVPSLTMAEIKITANSFFRKFNKNRIEVESESFEKLYDIMCIDRMYAMKIMKPNVIEAFVKVRQSGCKNLEVKIFGNTIFFRYAAGDIFEPAAVGDMFKPDKIKEFIMTIYNPINIVKALNYGLEEAKNI